MAKSETGLQLLVRLRTHISLGGIEPKLFGDGPHQGEIFEFHGSEGSAKTEMCLNLVVKCILPDSWKGVTMKGYAADVIFIDTQFKFSILRLTSLLEKVIRKALGPGIHSKGHKVIDCDKSLEKDLKFGGCATGGCAENGKDSGFMGIASHDATAATSMGTAPGDATIATNMGTTPQAATAATNMGITPQHATAASNSDVNDLIHDCLQRLHIIQTSSFFQLLMTLHSLDSLISTNPGISLIILDSISSYYWIERTDVGGKYSAIAARMKKIINILSLLLKSYGVVCVATTDSLFSRKRRLESSDSTADCGNSVPTHGGSNYLGQSWSAIIKDCFIFSKCAVNASEYVVNKIHSNDTQRFIIDESGITF